MAETIITKDGKCHVLLGSTTPVSIIRDYCGDEVADWVESNLNYMDRKELSDLGAYEADLDHLHRMMQDWADDLKTIADKLDNDRGFRKAWASHQIRIAANNIQNEL